MSINTFVPVNSSLPIVRLRIFICPLSTPPDRITVCEISAKNRSLQWTCTVRRINPTSVNKS
eukprot:scaffold4998_cov178-Alexandrium_tamarense.AAC.5